MKTFAIRAASLEDAPKIAGFQLEMARETEERDLDLATVTAGVAGALENPARGFYLVASDENDALIASLLVTFEWSDWRNGVFWWIQSVYVVPPARGRGVFRALFAAVQKRAQNDGAVCGLRLYVERDNQNAQAVYEKLGLIETPYRIYEKEF